MDSSNRKSRNDNTDNSADADSNSNSKKRKALKNKTASAAPSSSANADRGFEGTNVNLRSPLIHPIGIPMASLLNDASLSLSILYDESWKDLDINHDELQKYRTTSRPEPLGVRDNIFASAVSKWSTDQEKDLTNNIKAEIESRMNDNTLEGYEENDVNSLTVSSEQQVNGGKGILDFVVLKKNGDKIDKTKRSVVMIVEFGINHNIWWKKMHQMLLYVKMLSENTDENVVFDQPILLTVITVNQRDTKSEYSTINKASDTAKDFAAKRHNNSNMNDDTGRKVSDIHETEANTECSAENTGGGENLEVRLGVFLCTPKDDGSDGNRYRIALLWRHDTSCVHDASIQFGKVLYAAQKCASWREQLDIKLMKPNNGNVALYQYLGPNCCRIGESVSKYILFLPLKFHGP